MITDEPNEAARLSEPRPIHSFNASGKDAVTCIDCPPGSSWKNDRIAHLNSFYDVFTPDERQQIAQDLEVQARVRRRGEISARRMPLP